jgi:ketopantoate reductase
MALALPHVLVLGSGVIGQVLGGTLQRAGHKVTFYTRPDYLDRFREEGLVLHPRGGTRQHVHDAEFVADLDDFDRYGLILGCFRGDQRADLFRLLEPLPVDDKTLVLAMPVWRHSLGPELDRFAACHYLFPGVTGVYRGHHVAYRLRTTGLCPLALTLSDDTRQLAEAFSEAGLPARLKPSLVTDVQATMAAGFPVLLALSLAGFDVNAFSRDASLPLLAARAQKEALRIVLAGDDPVGLPGQLALWTPSRVVAWALGRMAWARGELRALLEEHFRKTHRQQLALTRELAGFPHAQQVDRRQLLELLDQCSV